MAVVVFFVMQLKPLPHATTRDICFWLFRRYRRFRVQGNSMMPSLSSQQEVLIDPCAYTQNSPLPEDIVVAYHPYQTSLLIVKRILFVEKDGRCYLQGDNAIESNDSRQFGLVLPQHLVGKVHCLFP